MSNFGSHRIERARIVPLLDSTPSAEGSPSKRSKKRSNESSPKVVYTYKEMISSDIPLAKKPKTHEDILDIVADEVENLLVESILAQDKKKERHDKKEAKRDKKEAKRAKKALIVNDK